MFRQLTFFFFFKTKEVTLFQNINSWNYKLLISNLPNNKIITLLQNCQFSSPSSKVSTHSIQIQQIKHRKKKKKRNRKHDISRTNLPYHKIKLFSLNTHYRYIQKKKKSTLFWAFLTSKVCRSGGVEWAQQESKTVEPHLDFFCYRV